MCPAHLLQAPQFLWKFPWSLLHLVWGPPPLPRERKEKSQNFRKPLLLLVRKSIVHFNKLLEKSPYCAVLVLGLHICATPVFSGHAVVMQEVQIHLFSKSRMFLIENLSDLSPGPSTDPKVPLRDTNKQHFWPLSPDLTFDNVMPLSRELLTTDINDK